MKNHENWESETFGSIWTHREKRKTTWVYLWLACKKGLFKGIIFGLIEVRASIDKRAVMRNEKLLKPFIFLSISILIISSFL
jgi:hypothetical protein